MILPAVRDPRLVSIRRGGLLADAGHQLQAMWAATCAEHVLELFEKSNRADDRPRTAIEAVRAWARGEALGAAAYAIKAASAAVPHEQVRGAARAERDWQRQQIPGHLRSLVLEDQNRRSSICWSVFDD